MTERSDNDYLTEADIVRVTGYVKPLKQCQKLESLGVFFSKRAIDGRPVTTWFHWNNPERMRLRATPISEKGNEPDFNFLRKQDVQRQIKQVDATKHIQK